MEKVADVHVEIGPRRQPVPENLVNQRPYEAGSVVNDVLEFVVLSVDVADHVDRALGRENDVSGVVVIVVVILGDSPRARM